MLKDILIYWDGHGDVDIGSLTELDNADERVIPFKAINLILSNGRTALVHNGEFIQHQVDDVSLYHGCYYIPSPNQQKTIRPTDKVINDEMMMKPMMKVMM